MNKTSGINIKNIIEYITTGIAIALFGLFFHADFAVILFALFLLIPCMSIGIIFSQQKKIRCIMQGKELVLDKGEKGSIFFEIINESIFPVTGLDIIFDCNQSIQYSREKTYRISLGGKRKLLLEESFTAPVFGLGKFRLQEMILEDFFGLIRLPVKGKTLGDESDTVIRVLPLVPNVSGIEQVYYACVGEEEEESNMGHIENAPLSTQNVLGYEHREYVPGDSFKKINWKLSAKKDIYMVRNDEQIASASPLIWIEEYIDMNFWSKRGCLHIYHEERLVEGCLGIVKSLLQLGMQVTVVFPGEHGYEEIKLYLLEDIGTLQNELVSIKFKREQHMAETSVEWEQYSRKSKSLMVFSVTLFEELQARISNLSPSIAVLPIVTEEVPYSLDRTLKISEDFSLNATRVQKGEKSAEYN